MQSSCGRMDTPWSCELPLEAGGELISERRVWPPMVVEIHVITNGPMHSTVSDDGKIEARALQTAFEVGSQELYSMVAMKENAGLRPPPPGRTQGGSVRPCSAGRGPSKPAPGMTMDDGCRVTPGFRTLRYVTSPTQTWAGRCMSILCALLWRLS